MFGVQKLKDEIEGLQEERNYFRSKFLEQVSEIASLKEALKQSEKEVSRLRRELMDGHPPTSPEVKRRTLYQSPKKTTTTPTSKQASSVQVSSGHDNEEEKKDEECLQGIENVLSSLSIEESSDEEDEDEQAAIRQKAEQLVRWASYRQEVLSPDRSVAATDDDDGDDDDDDNNDESEQ